MDRAVVLIGVTKTLANPQPLPGVKGCIAAMEEWAIQQKIPSHRIATFTDFDGNPVVPVAIYKQLEVFLKQDQIEQLVIYFAGHGFSSSHGDIWLLSEAPENQNAAINLSRLELAARKCPFEHVVLISDACRVSATNYPDMAPEGSAILPSLPRGGKSRFVDQFFAAAVDQPTLEVRVDNVYQSIYTGTLVEGLGGRHEEILEPEEPSIPNPVVVRPWPLEELLEREVPRRLRKLGVWNDGDGPDAIITSKHGKSWIATFNNNPPRMTQPSAQPTGGPDEPGPSGPDGPISPGDAFRRDIALILDRSGGPSKEALGFETSCSRGEEDVSLNFPGRSGLVVSGAEIQDIYPAPFQFVRLGRNRVRVATPYGPSPILVQFEGGDGVLIPVFPGFISHLKFEDGQLRNIFWEPSQNTSQWGLFQDKMEEFVELRTLFSSAVTRNAVRLDKLNRSQSRALNSSIQYEGGIDLSLAILVAYGYFAVHREELIPSIWARVVRAFHSCPLDIAMLMPPELVNRDGARFTGSIPLPISAQGWALMGELGESVPEALHGIQTHLISSAWTHLDSTGVGMVAEYLSNSRTKRRIRDPEMEVAVEEYSGAASIANDIIANEARPQTEEASAKQEEELEGFADA
jgi:hypothetical protein